MDSPGIEGVVDEHVQRWVRDVRGVASCAEQDAVRGWTGRCLLLVGERGGSATLLADADSLSLCFGEGMQVELASGESARDSLSEIEGILRTVAGEGFQEVVHRNRSGGLVRSTVRMLVSGQLRTFQCTVLWEWRLRLTRDLVDHPAWSAPVSRGGCC